MAHLKRPLATLSGSAPAKAFALDILEAEGRYNLETIFLTNNSPGLEEKPGSLPALAHRIRVELVFKMERTGGSLCRPLYVCAERKWRPEGFSLPVSSVVDSSLSSSRGVSTGLDINTVPSAVASNCFSNGATTATTSSKGEECVLTLPVGISVHAGNSWLEICYTDTEDKSTIMRRDFPTAAEFPGLSYTVKVSG